MPPERPPSIRVLGIDPGTLRMGYGLLEWRDDAITMVACGALTAPPRHSLGQRLHRIYSDLVDLLAEQRPDQVAIEEPFVAVNARTAMAIGQAQGLALLAAEACKLPVTRYAPAQVKLSVTGSGAASKEQVQQAVMLHLALASAPSPYDAADALAVALCHLQAVQVEGLRLR